MKPETRSFYELAVQGAVDRIVRDLDGALDLEALARHAALSPFHFHRVFRGMVGETPLELHRRLRMERAARHLRSGDTPVTHVAFDAGYDTHEAFTRAFRARFGVSPTEFRKGIRPDFEPAARSGLHFAQDPGIPARFRFLKGETSMKAEILDRPELRVVMLRHVGPYGRIGETFGRLAQLAGPAGLLGPEGTCIGIFHDDPDTTPEEELRSEAAVVVGDGARVPAGLTEGRIPAGRYARTMHVGPYDGLKDAWSRFVGEWLPQSGLGAGDAVAYEVYCNDPQRTPPAELRTEMYLPIA